MVEKNTKELNREQVQRAFDVLLQQVTEPNKTYSVPISELYFGNSRITGAELTMAIHSTMPDQAITIVKIKKDSTDIISRDFMLGKVGEGENAVSTLTSSLVSHPKLEGAGLATAVIAQTEPLVEKTLELAKPSTEQTIYVVTDRAKGMEKDRQGWTSNQMQKLGFDSNVEIIQELSDLLGLQLTPEEMERTYYKAFQNPSASLDENI